MATALWPRVMWFWRGGERPSFAVAPGPGQESVWDYPRPPAVYPDPRRVQVFLGDRCIADTCWAFRVLETAGAPTFYLPPADIDEPALVPSSSTSRCEWKGRARYWHVRHGPERARDAAWAYPEAAGRFAPIAGYIAFYAHALDCRVDGERARAQPGGFYGGWVTDDVVGPFKGEPGTEGW